MMKSKALSSVSQHLNSKRGSGPLMLTVALGLLSGLIMISIKRNSDSTAREIKRSLAAAGPQFYEGEALALKSFANRTGKETACGKGDEKKNGKGRLCLRERPKKD